MRVPSPLIRSPLASVFLAWGMSAPLAETTAELMLKPDLCGVGLRHCVR